MNTRRMLLLTVSHAAVLAVGFAAGVYTLPLLIAPPTPSESELQAAAATAVFTGTFRRDLKGSDALHWGEGVVSVGPQSVSHSGRLAPGPDYKLYLSPEFVETEAEFLTVKSRMARIGDVRTFDGFLVAVPASVEPARFTTVIVWCESFGEFITAARYR